MDDTIVIVPCENQQQTRVVYVSRKISYDQSLSLINLLVGVYACIVGFMNTHDDCYMNTGIGKLNLPIMLLFMGFVFAISGSGNLYKNDYSKKADKTDGCGACFTIIWLVMYGIILFNGNSTCKADNTLFYYTALGVWIYSLVLLCLVGERRHRSYTTVLIVEP